MRISKNIFGMAVAVALLASCNQDNEGTIYTATNDGITFGASSLPAVEVAANEPTFTVELTRSNIAEAQSGTVTAAGTVVVKGDDGKDKTVAYSDFTVSNYSFAAGESRAYVTIDVSELEIGTVLTIKLTLDDADNVAISGAAATTVKVSKAYTWISLGKGYFLDNFFGMESEPEILQAEGFRRWRVIEPCEAYRLDPENAGDDWIATSSAPYIELWEDEDGNVLWNAWFTGQNYDGDDSQPIYAYHPSAFKSLSDPAYWTFSKFLDDTTIQLAPYYYIDGLGGWNYTQYNGVVYIVLPE